MLEPSDLIHFVYGALCYVAGWLVAQFQVRRLRASAKRLEDIAWKFQLEKWENTNGPLRATFESWMEATERVEKDPGPDDDRPSCWICGHNTPADLVEFHAAEEPTGLGTCCLNGLACEARRAEA